MQVSKKLLIAEFSKIVAEYESLYARFGDAQVWYNQAVGKVNGLGMFFYSDDPEVDAAFDLASEQVGNIFCNGDKHDYSRPQQSADLVPLDVCRSCPVSDTCNADGPSDCLIESATAKQDKHSEPVTSVHIHGNDFEEVLTESDFELFCSVRGIPIQKHKTRFSCSNFTPFWIGVHRRFIARTPSKRLRISRLPNDDVWTGASRWTVNFWYRPGMVLSC